MTKLLTLLAYRPDRTFEVTFGIVGAFFLLERQGARGFVRHSDLLLASAALASLLVGVGWWRVARSVEPLPARAHYVGCWLWLLAVRLISPWLVIVVLTALGAGLQLLPVLFLGTSPEPDPSSYLGWICRRIGLSDPPVWLMLWFESVKDVGVVIGGFAVGSMGFILARLRARRVFPGPAHAIALRELAVQAALVVAVALLFIPTVATELGKSGWWYRGHVALQNAAAWMAFLLVLVVIVAHLRSKRER